MTTRLAAALMTTVLALASAGGAHATQKPRPDAQVLPNFDVRLPTTPAAAVPESRVQSVEADAALERLRAEAGGALDVRRNQRGVVLTFGEPSGPRGRARAAIPEGNTAVLVAMARRFIARNHAALGLAPGDVPALRLAKRYASRNEPLVHLRYLQEIDGLHVVGARVDVHLTKDGRVVKVASSAVTRGGGTGAPALAPQSAWSAAMANVLPGPRVTPGILSGPTGPTAHTVFDAGPLAANAELELVLFPMAGAPRLAWQAILQPPGFPQKYQVIVDAGTGDLLYRRNLIIYVDGRARVLQADATRARDPRLPDEHPSGTEPSSGEDPPQGCPPANNHVIRSLTDGFRDPGTLLFDGGLLSGNNVHVFDFAVGLEGTPGTTGPDGAWEFDASLGTAAATQAQLFFVSNFLHDFFYDLGFDEAAGNFQRMNFGRGGAGGDPLFVLARADGRNNATFEPKPEGQSPIMSMFLWDGTGCWAEDVDGDRAPDLDGGLDADVVIHEFHHGVSTRLNTEFTGPEADAIGEGGSDFFAYSINGNTSLAEYSFPPYGIRQVNARTYGSWWCWFDLLCEPHDNGEIWANVLWDLRERFRADLVDGTNDAAVRAAHLLYVDGLKLSPPAPTMLDLRDAMLLADVIRRPSHDPGGSVNHCRIWEVFALRGMGAAARDTNDTWSLTVVEDVSMPPVCPALPPPATVTIAATDASAQEHGPDVGVFTVTRAGDTTRPLTVYLSSPSGSALEGTDYLALPASLTIPAGSSSAILQVVPIDDPNVEPNETVALAVVAGPGYRVVAPSSATVSIVSDDVAADFVVAALTGPQVGGAGASFAVNESTKNQGSGAAGPTVTRFYLSANAAIDANDVVVGGRDVPALGAGETSATTVTLVIPAETPAGTYYVLARADADNAVTEVSETNNVRSMTIRIGPDLIVATFTAPAVAEAGSSVLLNDTTKNQGGGTAGPSETGFYLSANTSLDAADVRLGGHLVPSLAANTTHATTTSVVIPGDIVAGVWYLIARADTQGAVPETSETNNVAVAQVRIGADLVVSAITAAGTTGAGSSLVVNETTKNQGGATSLASTTRLYLSSDTLLGADDVAIGSRAVPALASGASSVAATSVTIPVSTTTGNYYVIAQADADNANDETNETNNSNRVSVRVGPDLVVATLTVTALAEAGSTVTVTDTTKNQGGGPAAASATRFFLSANSTLDAADVAIGSRSVPSLAPGGTSTASTSGTIPAGTAAGVYYILAQADGPGEVVETIETNNTVSAQLKIGPDLAIVAASVTPLAAAAGASISVTVTTKNNGGGVAGASTNRFLLSSNSTPDSGDAVIGSRAVPVLGAGASDIAATTLTIPTGIAAGAWYVFIVADANETVAETFENNNTRSVLVNVGPDLKVASVTGPASVVNGATFSVTDVTRNDGGGLASPSTTRFFLSQNATLDASDVALGGREVPQLAGAASHSAVTTLVVPAGTSPGRYYLIARADGDGVISEVSESNNTTWVLITVN